MIKLLDEVNYKGNTCKIYGVSQDRDGSYYLGVGWTCLNVVNSAKEVDMFGLYGFAVVEEINKLIWVYAPDLFKKNINNINSVLPKDKVLKLLKSMVNNNINSAKVDIAYNMEVEYRYDRVNHIFSMYIDDIELVSSNKMRDIINF